MHLQRTFDNVTLPEEMADTTIVVLGLLEMGYTDTAWIADLLHVRDKRSLRRLLWMLKTSQNPVVRQCVDRGLPPGLSRPFPHQGATVRCPICRNLVRHAPCPKCSLSPIRYSSLIQCEPSSSDEECPFAATPTSAVPGTRRKVKVMRRRVAKGLSAFHPQDGPRDSNES